jgi:hypothetical protein
VDAIAGPNGAGKTTFYRTFLSAAGLRFVNADVVAGELKLDAYEAARLASSIRNELIRQRESFVFETVFSDPAGEKLEFLLGAAQTGYQVVLCFIGLSEALLSVTRVAMRVTQGGHDVPSNKLAERFPRTLGNLRAAVSVLPNVLIFDNSDLRDPYRRVAEFQSGQAVYLAAPVPKWLLSILPEPQIVG